jgi:hypothetical protein
LIPPGIEQVDGLASAFGMDVQSRNDFFALLVKYDD